MGETSAVEVEEEDEEKVEKMSLKKEIIQREIDSRYEN